MGRVLNPLNLPLQSLAPYLLLCRHNYCTLLSVALFGSLGFSFDINFRGVEILGGGSFCHTSSYMIIYIAESFDFMGVSDATITFQPGQTEFNFTVPTVDDDVNELTEMFTAVLSNPVGAMLGTDTNAMIMINDNDGELIITAPKKEFLFLCHFFSWFIS